MYTMNCHILGVIFVIITAGSVQVDRFEAQVISRQKY